MPDGHIFPDSISATYYFAPTITPFMGILFSGQLSEDKINKLLPHYMNQNKNIEIVFHPGYLERGESLIDGCQPSFEKFYYSKWRRVEFNTLINFRKY